MAPDHDHGGGADSLSSLGVWQSDAVALTGTVLIVLLAIGYLALRARSAARPSTGRAACLLGGLALLAVTLFSGVAMTAHGDLAVHVGQCLVVMMAVAPLIVIGRPGQVLLEALPAATRHELAETANDPLVRGMSAGRWAGLLLVADYYGSMAVYLLTPLYRWSTEQLWLHVAAHVYFLLCGLLFWAPLLGPHAVPIRTGLRRTLVGVPINIAVGLVIVLGGAIAPADAAGTQLAGWVFLAGGGLLSVLGVVIVATHQTRRRSRLLNPEVRWRAVS